MEISKLCWVKEAYVHKEYILYASVDMKSGTGIAKVWLGKKQRIFTGKREETEWW